MENIICNLCAGSSDIDLYKIEITKEQQQFLGKNKDEIYVDICIGKEVEFLINQGIRTYGCCCSHGKGKPQILVGVKSKKKLEELGYSLYEFTERHTKSGIYMIDLKTDVQKELRKVIEGKVWRYLGRE